MATTPGDVTRNLRDGTLYVQDNGDNEVELDLDEGDLSVKWGNEDRLVKNRGSVANGHFRAGDEEPVEVTFTAKVSKIVADDTSLGGSDGNPSAYNALRQTGPASGWSSCGDSGEPYLCRLVFKLANPDTSGRREVITIDKFREETVEFSEGEEYDTLAFSGRARIAAPVFSFEAQT